MKFFPMNTRQHHGIKVGDLVKFKHHIFDEHQPVWLVTEVRISDEFTSPRIRLHDIFGTFRSASDFVVVRHA